MIVNSINLGVSDTDYNITITPFKKWIISAWVLRNDVGNATFQFVVRTSDGIYHFLPALVSPILPGTWGRVTASIDLSSNSSTNAMLIIAMTVSGDMYVDGIMLEVAVGNLEVASSYSLPAAQNVAELGYLGDLNADVTNYADYRVSNSQTENAVTTIANPQGGTFNSNSANVTGAIVITLPQSWTDTMMKFEVDVFDYVASKSFTIKVGGCNYPGDSSWRNEFAQIVGSILANNRVRFTHNGTKCCVIIGETASVWQHPKIAVKNFQAGHSNYSIAQWEAGWNVSLVTDLTGYATPTRDFSDALLDAKSILGQGVLATQNTVDWDANQVIGTNAPADNADVTATNVKVTALLTLYYQTAQNTVPSTPANGSGVYNFALKFLTSPPAGWGILPPTTGSGKVWTTVTTYAALGQDSVTDDGSNTFTAPASSYALNATNNTGALADQNEVDWATQVIGHYLPDFFNRSGFYKQELFINLDDYITSIPSGTSISVGSNGMTFVSSALNRCSATHWDFRLYNGWSHNRGFKTALSIDSNNFNFHEIGIGADTFPNYLRFYLDKPSSGTVRITAQYSANSVLTSYIFPVTYATSCYLFLSAYRDVSTGDILFQVDSSTGSAQSYTMSATATQEGSSSNILFNVDAGSGGSTLVITDWYFLQEA